MVAIVRMLAVNPEKIKVRPRSEVLAAWCLPMMSRSLKAEEDEAAAFEMLKAVEKMKSKK
jgi:hypothetical protein